MFLGELVMVKPVVSSLKFARYACHWQSSSTSWTFAKQATRQGGSVTTISVRNCSLESHMDQTNVKLSRRSHLVWVLFESLIA